MKKNIFPFIPDANLIADVDCLLKFIRQPLYLEKFFKKIPDGILNAKLHELEFESENSKHTQFVIKLKDNTVVLVNEDLSSFGITITDSTQLINPFIDYKKNLKNLNLKDTLTEIITTNNNKNKQINIENVINTLKNTALNYSNNKNKQILINLFFNVLKKLIISDSICKNFTSESLLTTANDLSRLELQYPDLNAIISKMHISLEKRSRKESFNAPEVLLAYEKLFYKLSLYFPESGNSKTKIHKIIDIAFEIENNNEIINSNYNFFKLSYFGKKGFRYIFGDERNIELYNSIQASCKNFNSFKQQYIEIINLIGEVYILADNNHVLINLTKQLNYFTDSYFQALLDISNSNANKESLEKCKKNALTNFQKLVIKTITEFQEKNTLNLNQINILDKILNKIAKLIPSFILSKDKRIGFFQLRTPQNKKLNILLDAVLSKSIYKL